MSSPEELARSNESILDVVSKITSMDKVQALLKLLELKQIDIEIVGEIYKVLNQELTTDYVSPAYVKFMVKNETWRKSVQEVLHLKNIDNEKLVGFMDTQVILKMVSYKRKRSQEIVNGLRNELSGTEVIPTNTRRKKFLGMI